jgi:Transposase family tnp2
MYILYRLPRRGAVVLLAGMRSILKSQPSLVPLANEVPKDPRRILALYHLDPVTHSYICCPACYFLYPYSIVKSKKRKLPAFSGEIPNLMENTEGDASGDAPFVSSTPVNCTHRRVRSGATCGEPLFNSVTINGNGRMVPRLKYHAQDLKQWVGWLLSRSAIEEEVFKAFRRLRKERMEDAWDARHLCKVLLKRGERFLPGPIDETRLAFSFSMDGFNPYHMKESKQAVSSTAIWLVLLNLPSHLRYRPENMFLAGIIPGPRKPSLSDVNHSIKLLVDVLLEFFDPGVRYSRTAKHRHGRRVRAILVPVVSDMPAARQAGGFASTTATFFCTLCSLKIQDIENLDRSTWPERDVGEHIQFARRWRDAQTIKEQETLFKDHGIRWSPLLDLPYWNPILFTAIEPMHVFDAGLFQTHCRQVWGIDTTALSGDGLTAQSAMAVSRPSDSELGEWYEVIRKLKKPEDLRERLKGCARDTLWHICRDNELRRAGQKLQLAEAIVEWVRQSLAYMCAYTYVRRSARRSHPIQSDCPLFVPQSLIK